MDEMDQINLTVPLIDTHAHIQVEDFSRDIDGVISRAREAGVDKVIVVGGAGALSSNESGLKLCGRYPGLFASVGIHPHDALEVSREDFEGLRKLAEDPKVVAVGETGLDYYYEHSPRPLQRELFTRFIHMACDMGLPLIVHNRDAHREVAELIRNEGEGDVSGVIHCFTGDWPAAQAFLDLGLYLSFTGIITFKNAGALREVVQRVPLDRLLVETDSPYLAPVPHRGKRNEPAFVQHVVDVIAQVKGLSLDEVARTTTYNAQVLFGI